MMKLISTYLRFSAFSIAFLGSISFLHCSDEYQKPIDGANIAMSNLSNNINNIDIIDMFERRIEEKIKEAAAKMPVIGIFGPPQSGKTTLVKAIFRTHRYVDLRNYKNREFAISDPKRFLLSLENPHGIILDEIQHTPALLSYIQTYVDEYPKHGYIVITGSHNILLNQAISQTLAGRIALFMLPPLSIAELSANNILPATIEQLIFKGCYPRIYAHDLDPIMWYADYIQTYVERDARQIAHIEDLSTFKRFLGLCAGRVGQLLNYTSLAADCGIDQRTAKAWMSILEASYVIFLLQPHHVNFSKRLIKTPKLYFYDTGVACSLLDIQASQQLHTHYLRGSLVESIVMSEIFKHYFSIGKRPQSVYFWRNQTGDELDCVIQKGNDLVPIEIKAGTTISNSFFDGLKYWAELSQTQPNGYVIYTGEENQERSAGTVVSWKHIEKIF